MITTLHFAQSFDNRPYLSKISGNTPSINNQHLGTLGLLGFLERELGLSGTYPDNMDRVSLYAKALSQHLQTQPNAFYANSFQTDELGVTKDLIKWRDDLIMLGWKNLPVDEQPERLRTLALVEPYFVDGFQHYGLADRWQDVLNAIPSNFTVTHFKIRVYDHPEWIHPFFIGLFKKLAHCIEYADINEKIKISDNNLGRVKSLLLGTSPALRDLQPLSSDNSLAILKINDNHQASDLLANQIKLGYRPLVINADNKLFDYYLTAHGLPASGSKLNHSNPLIIQLFKLISVGLTAPIQVYNLLSLLQSPYAPIPKKLAARLARLLIDKPGVDSPEWNHTIATYFDELMEKENDKAKVEKKRDQVLLYLTFNFEKTIDTKRIKNVYASLSIWADQHALLDVFGHSPEERDQFAYLSKMSKALIKTITDEVVAMEAPELLKKIDSIYEPASFVNEVSQVNAVEAISSPDELLDAPEVIWWHDCYDALFKADHHAFLFISEIHYLQSQGIDLYSPANQIKMAYEKAKMGILMAQEQCVLVVVEKHNGEETSAHPLLSEIEAFFKNLTPITTQMEQIEQVAGLPLTMLQSRQAKLPEAKSRWQINNPQTLDKRQTESASSIEKLIQHPFEWVIRYQAKLNAGNSFTLPDLFTLKGKIAHTATESLINQWAEKPDMEFTDEAITDCLTKKIKEEGLLLMLPEMRFEYEALLRKYKLAFRSLISIITGNQLKVIGCELRGKNEIPGIGHVEGLMDLVLEDKNGQQVIFDLKWTQNNKKYQTKLEEGKAIQLSIYHALLGNNPKTAYFMFDNAKLYTLHNLVGENVIPIVNSPSNTDQEVLNKTINSLNFRWSELKEGDIEIGDEVKVDDLPYFNATEESNLIPLDFDKIKKVKYGDHYSGLELFKGFIQ